MGRLDRLRLMMEKGRRCCTRGQHMILGVNGSAFPERSSTTLDSRQDVRVLMLSDGRGSSGRGG